MLLPKDALNKNCAINYNKLANCCIIIVAISCCNLQLAILSCMKENTNLAYMLYKAQCEVNINSALHLNFVNPI